MGEVIKAKPWLPKVFIEEFEKWNTGGWKMWEFGSGFSTPWFAQRVSKLWSMEHEPRWHRAAKKACERKGLDNVHLYLRKRGEGYESKINEFPDGFFDVILVDGRNRVKCFMNAFPKASRVIALDNAMRERYLEARKFMSGHPEWEPKLAKWTEPVVRNGEVVPHKDVWDCLVWVKKGVSLVKQR